MFLGVNNVFGPSESGQKHIYAHKHQLYCLWQMNDKKNTARPLRTIYGDPIIFEAYTNYFWNIHSELLEKERLPTTYIVH